MATNIPGVNIDVSADVSGLKQAAVQSTKALDSITDAAQDTAVAINSVEEASKKLRAARAEYERLRLVAAELRNDARQAGQKIGDDVSASINKQISAANVEVARARAEFARAQAQAPVGAGPKELEAVGKSAREIANDLKQLNFQITDIVTGLASGQSPLTVLIQQGGQLKDMFGGVGGAVRALGQGIAAIVTPLTALTAGLGVIAIGFVKGVQENNAFSQAVLNTGYSAGVTESQLRSMAIRVAQTSGTVGQAAKALADMAGSGNVSAAALEDITRAAVKLQNAGGRSIEETVQIAKQLGESPTEAALRLNRAYNFLNVSTFDQIKRLEELGDRLAAAAIAQKAFADATSKVADEQTKRLGILERAYRGVISAAKGFGDAFLEIGRDQTLQQQIDQVSGKLQFLRNELTKGRGNDSVVQRWLGVDTASQIKALESQLALLQLRLQEGSEQAADAAADAAKRERDLRIARLGPQTAEVQAQYSALADAQRAGLAQQREQLDSAYAQSLVTIEQYWAQRIELEKQQGQVELNALEVQLQDLRDKLAAGVPLEQLDALKAQIAAAEGKIGAQRIKGATDLLKLEEDLRKARQAADQVLQDQLAERERVRNLDALILERSLSTLDEVNRRGLISIQNYYAEREKLINAEFDNEKRVAEARLALAQETLRRAPPDQKPAAQRELLDIQNQLEAIEERRTNRFRTEGINRTNNLREQNDLYSQRRLQLEELSGLETSEIARTERQAQLLAKYREELERVRKTDAARAMELERIIKITEADAEFAAQKTKLSRDNLKFTEQEAQIQFERQQGRINEEEAQRRLAQVARERAAAELQVYEAVKLAVGSNLSADARAQLESYIASARRGIESLSPAAQQLNQALQQGFANAIQGLLDGTKSVKDAFKSLAQSVVQQFTVIVSRNLAGQIFAGLGGGAFGGGLGKIFGFADGGMVSGPGTTRSDSIPARLSNGEFVQPARTVQHYGADFMEALRNLRVPRSSGAGSVRGFADGGLVGSSNSAATAARSQDMPVQVNIQNSGTGKTATAESRFDSKGLVVSILLDDIRTNGPIYQNMTNASRLRR